MVKNNDNNKTIVEDQLKRISSDFELDILRLIKTQSMISTTSEIINRESDAIKDRSNDFQNVLNEFSDKIHDLSRNLSNHENAVPLQKNINDILSAIEDYRSRTRKIRDEVDRVTNENMSKLDSLHEFYSMELQAFQEGLDTRIQELQKNIIGTIYDKHDILQPTESESSDMEREPLKTIWTEKPPAAGKEELIADKPKKKANNKKEVSKSYIAASVLVLIAVAIYLFQVFSPEKIGFFTGPVPAGDQKQLNHSEKPKKTVAPDKKVQPNILKHNEKVNTLEKSDHEGRISKVQIPENTVPVQHNVSSPKKAGIENNIEDKLVKVDLYELRVKGANVRSGPGKGYKVVTVLRTGDTFIRTRGETDRWMKIKTEDDQIGWIAKSLVRKTGETP